MHHYTTRSFVSLRVSRFLLMNEVFLENPDSHCPKLGTPISGNKKGHRHDLGSVVKFSCKEGYVLVGSSVRQCQEDGTWNGTEAKCMSKYNMRYHRFEVNFIYGHLFFQRLHLISNTPILLVCHFTNTLKWADEPSFNPNANKIQASNQIKPPLMNSSNNDDSCSFQMTLSTWYETPTTQQGF